MIEILVTVWIDHKVVIVLENDHLVSSKVVVDKDQDLEQSLEEVDDYGLVVLNCRNTEASIEIIEHLIYIEEDVF